MTGPTWLSWPPVGRVGRVVGDRDGNPDTTRVVALSQPLVSSGWLLAKAAMNRSGGPGRDPAVDIRRPCHGPDGQRLRRVLEAVMLGRPDTNPARGWGG